MPTLQIEMLRNRTPSVGGVVYLFTINDTLLHMLDHLLPWCISVKQQLGTQVPV